ncbi:LysR family transcriptional regulator [Mangrovibacter phragmitis]|uniref:LysR family transcriptional regulator n=1 Tax=Mangrovibacter phragmitis TaxID=1691903 RepID=A0A1B7L1R1_9ENTR|nr:YbeF family transcriptional regulator [Mangrovibacter phragmitis]OAT76198.1 LysR family transcriptional regulator [Mangrovibacter phragmitis]
MNNTGKDNNFLSRSNSARLSGFQALRTIDLNLLTVFEAVYIHKGIVNAARALNLTPSAISQSIQKLRNVFPDPLFVRNGQGIMPTSYAAHLHEYISQGLSSILGALEFNEVSNAQRTITIATHPSVGALVMPTIYKAIHHRCPNININNVPISQAETQLSQLQADMVIDTRRPVMSKIGSFRLFEERVVIVCRNDHPELTDEVSLDILNKQQQTMLVLQDDILPDVRNVVEQTFPDRQITFSSYNVLTLAAMLANSDLVGFMSSGLYHMFRDNWNLREVECEGFAGGKFETHLFYNKLSQHDEVLRNCMETIQNAFVQKHGEAMF